MPLGVLETKMGALAKEVYNPDTKEKEIQREEGKLIYFMYTDDALFIQEIQAMQGLKINKKSQTIYSSSPAAFRSGDRIRLQGDEKFRKVKDMNYDYETNEFGVAFGDDKDLYASKLIELQ